MHSAVTVGVWRIVTHCEKWLRKSHSCWKRLAEARYARMKSYYTAVSTSAAVLVGMLAL